MDRLRESIEFAEKHWKSFMGIELAYFGTVLMGMIIAYFHPNVQDYYEDSTEKQLQESWIGRLVTEAYDTNQFFKAGSLTFIVNVLIGSFVPITLFNFCIPYSGLILTFYRALLWGFLFAPIKPNAFRDTLPHYFTLFFEGEAYILTALPAWLHSRQTRMIFLNHQGQGYKAWLKLGYELTLQAYPLIIVILFFSAFYEAYEVIYLLPPSIKKFGH